MGRASPPAGFTPSPWKPKCQRQEGFPGRHQPPNTWVLALRIPQMLPLILFGRQGLGERSSTQYWHVKFEMLITTISKGVKYAVGDMNLDVETWTGIRTVSCWLLIYRYYLSHKTEGDLWVRKNMTKKRLGPRTEPFKTKEEPMKRHGSLPLFCRLVTQDPSVSRGGSFRGRKSGSRPWLSLSFWSLTGNFWHSLPCTYITPFTTSTWPLPGSRHIFSRACLPLSPNFRFLIGYHTCGLGPMLMTRF